MNKIKGATSEDRALIDTVFDHGQGHVFKWWDYLSEVYRKALLRQLSQIDFKELESLAHRFVFAPDVPFEGKMTPPEVTRVPSTAEQRKARDEARALGEELLRAGKVCAFTVAGGQGTRLGFDGPKGAFPITPVKKKPLFQLFAERIQATGRRYETRIRWFIMVSETNHEQTQQFFDEHRSFGIHPGQIQMFRQRMIPALDMNGKLILSEKHRIFTNPNGHGGSLLALKDSGALETMQAEEIEEIFYFQIDNVLCRVLDPTFIGYHHKVGAQMSSKVVRKTVPTEKVGLIGRVDGKLGCIEYSDISETDAARRNADGTLVFSSGNLAMHMLRVDFVDELTREGFSLPYHKAIKKIPYIDDSGNPVTPEQPNGVKLETFVFDALSFTRNAVTMEVARPEEFSPVKNADGENSPQTARRALTELYARWLKTSGVHVPLNEEGISAHPIEISPMYALDDRELTKKIQQNLKIEGPLYLE